MSSESQLFLTKFDLPADPSWSDLDEVPASLKRVTEIYSMALEDNVEGQVSQFTDINEMYEVYDQLDGQDCYTAQVVDIDEIIVGVASYDPNRRPFPFLEGIAVDPNYRGLGVAQKLLSFVLDSATAAGTTEVHARSQPSSLAANQRIIRKIGLDAELANMPGAKYPLLRIFL